MSAKYKSPSFLLPNELNTSANPATGTGVNSLYSMDFGTATNNGIYFGPVPTMFIEDSSVSIWFKSEVANSNNVIFNRHTAGTGNFNDTYVIRTELSGRLWVLVILKEYTMLQLQLVVNLKQQIY